MSYEEQYPEWMRNVVPQLQGEIAGPSVIINELKRLTEKQRQELRERCFFWSRETEGKIQGAPITIKQEGRANFVGYAVLAQGGAFTNDGLNHLVKALQKEGFGNPSIQITEIAYNMNAEAVTRFSTAATNNRTADLLAMDIERFNTINPRQFSDVSNPMPDQENSPSLGSIVKPRERA
ncbi:MAG: hypothetical protein V1746_02595 [bacterium]